MKEIEEIYNNLSEENKDIINLVAKGMQIAQSKGGITIEKIKTNNTK